MQVKLLVLSNLSPSLPIQPVIIVLEFSCIMTYLFHIIISTISNIILML